MLYSFFIAVFFVFFTSNASYNPDYPQFYFPYYSQAGQDKFLNEEIFHGKRNGTFIDVGAHDGISYSNTYYFEKELGWKGICIEPHPKNFKLLSQNRNASCYQVCAGNKNDTVYFLEVDGAPEMLSGIYDFYDPQHLARIQYEITVNGGSSNLIQLPLRTISSILDEQQLYTIDFISIDVEGGEIAVLEGIDFNRFYIKYILIENNQYHGFFDTIKTFLEKYGYKHLCSVKHDELFIKK